jgi:hypothetical protein
MAGRPRKMAERVEELEEMGLAVSVLIFEIMPDQYREKMMTHGFAEWRDAKLGDSLSQAWYDSACRAMVASQALGQLGNLLRAKADIQRPGPHEAFSAEIKGLGKLDTQTQRANECKDGLR